MGVVAFLLALVGISLMLSDKARQFGELEKRALLEEENRRLRAAPKA